MPPTNPAVKLAAAFYAEQRALNSAARAGGAEFQLCLSLFEARATDNPCFRDTDFIVEDSDFPDRLNHYRRPSMSVDSQKLDQHLKWQQALSQTMETSTIKLWQALHPDPLSFEDNPNKIPAEVKFNCSYRTQSAWFNKVEQDREEQGSDTNEPDPTLLADLIPIARSYSAVT